MANEDKIEFTSTEEIKKIQPEQNVELIGYVDAIEATKEVGQNSEIFRFTLNNGDDMRIQIIVWNDDIKRVEKEISLDSIIHLENAKSKKNTHFSYVNFTNAEIVIQKYTIVENLGKINKSKFKSGTANLDNNELPVIPLNEINNAQLPTKLRTTGYVKTNFALLNSENSVLQKAWCSITDGVYKLDVTIKCFKPGGFERGDKIIIAGNAYLLKDVVHFMVESMDDIKKVEEEKKSLTWLLKGKTLINFGSHTSKKQKI